MQTKLLYLNVMGLILNDVNKAERVRSHPHPRKLAKTKNQSLATNLGQTATTKKGEAD